MNDEGDTRARYDAGDVIELEQEDGLPVEKKVAEGGQSSEEDKPSIKEPAKKCPQRVWSLGKKVFCTLAVVLLCALTIGGGMLAGMKLQQKQDVEGVANGENIDRTSPVFGEAGRLVTDVTLAPGEDKLALAFLKLHNTKINSCYSPLSIRYALEMLREGANGETKAQIDSLLGNRTAPRYKDVAEHLSVANSLWVNNAWQDKVQADYVDALNNKFDAALKVDDFSSATNMNQWIEDNTLGLMKDVLSNEDVQDLYVALVNVLAIDMEWQTQFDKLDTIKALFANDEYLENSTHATSDDDYVWYAMMHRFDGEDVYYNLADNATVLAMDLKEYGDTKLQFVAFKPKDLVEFVNSVTVDGVNELISGMKMAVRRNDTYNYSFSAYIPKFKIEGGIDVLLEDLKELGVTDISDSTKADFSPIAGDEPFAIDAATHKTLFEFSEEGIKAAVATILGGRGAAGGPTPIPSSVSVVVSINGPFMYMVRDVKTGEIWFTGTVYEPTRWEDVKEMYDR